MYGSEEDVFIDEAIEKLPTNRFKLPLGIRGSFFIGDRLLSEVIIDFIGILGI